MVFTKWEALGFICIVLFGLAYFFYNKKLSGKVPDYDHRKLLVCKREVNLKIADTNPKRARGLMFVENMAEDEGMLFIFGSKSFHSFWMKNTFIPLDILWLDEDYKVVHFVENAKPCPNGLNCEIFVPKARANFVLELNGGWIQKYCGNIANVQISEI